VRTNIVLDDALLAAAMQRTGMKTKRHGHVLLHGDRDIAPMSVHPRLRTF
jgi:hypothetical protein